MRSLTVSDYSMVKVLAGDIADSALLCMFSSSEADKYRRASQHKEIEGKFVRMAEALGYDVEKMLPPI